MEMEDEEIPEAVDESQFLMSSDTMEQIMRLKEAEKTRFESYWEKDENDIECWTKNEIQEDPSKQLLTYAEEGKLSEIKELFSMQPDPNSIEKLLRYKDTDGYTALHRSSYSNSLDVVKYILSFEKHNRISNLNQLQVQTEMGWTPLHSAVFWNCFNVVEFLIKHPNVNVNWRSGSGQTSLHLTASQSSHRETILLLLTHLDIRYDIKNDQEETAHTIANRSCKYNSLFEIADENLIKLF